MFLCMIQGLEQETSSFLRSYSYHTIQPQLVQAEKTFEHSLSV